MGFRLFFLMMAVACGLGLYGWNELTLNRGSGTAPVPITAENLEKGVPDNPYRTLGKHFPLGSATVYSFLKKTGSITASYYPIFSETAVKEAADRARKKNPDRKLSGQDILAETKIRAIIKTDRFHTEADLQSAVEHDNFPTDNVTGMVINKVDSLSSDEEALLKKSFPTFDKNDVVILEQGRTPTSAGMAIGMLAGSAVLALSALGVLAIRRRKK